MSLTVNPWRKSILQQIQIRNKVEQYPYESIITTCNSLFEKIDSLQREKLQLENNSTTNANKEKIIQLQDEIKEYKQSSTKFDETITELRAQLQKCDNERQEYKTKHTETLNMLQEAQRDSKALQEKINELESQNVLVTDEHQALQIAYTSLKEKYDSLEVNYSEIVNRFMALKAKDAEILNEENEKMLMIQREKMKKQLQEATKTMMVTSEAINEMNAINEDRIMNPLLINAILPSKESKSFEAHESEIYALKWNVRTEQLASGGGDRKVKLWEITNDGRTDCMTCLTGSNASVTSIDIFEEFLVASSNDYASRVWTLNDFRLRRTLTGHSNKVMSVKFLGVSHKVVSGSYDRTLKIWDLNRNACVRTLFAGSSCNDLVNIDSKETLVASAHFDKRIRFWDTRVEASPNDILLQGKVTSLDVSADGRWLLCSVRDDTLKCLDLRMNQVVRDYTADGFNVGCDWTRARFSPDHRFVACGGFDSNIYIWDFLTSRLETCLSSNVHSGTVVSVEWSPNGSLFVSADRVRREERNVLDELLDNQEDDELDVELNKGFRVKTRNIKMLKQYGKSSTLTGKEIDTTSGGQTDSKFKAINLNGTRKRPPSRADSSCSGYSPHSGSCSCEDHSAESRSRSPASVAGSQCSYQSFTRSPSLKIKIHKNSDSRMVKRSPPPPSRPTRPHPAESLIQDHRKRPKYVDDHHRQHYQHDNVRHQRNPKIISTSSTNTNVGKKRSYQSLLKYFFKDSCYFVMKSNNSENINISKREGVWATPSANEMKLTSAFREFRNVILIFSVKESGKFQGFARLSSEANYDCEPVNWVLPPSINSCPFGGLFYVDWICQHELPFTETTHLFNPFNEGKPVKIARDGQEIDPRVGEELCRLFPSDDLVDLIPLLKRMKKQTKNRPKKRHSRGPFMETADHQQHRMPSLHGRHHSSTNPILSIKRRLGGHGNGSSSSSLNNRTSTNNRRMVDHHRMAVNDRAIFRRDHILDDDGYNYRSSHPNNPSLNNYGHESYSRRMPHSRHGSNMGHRSNERRPTRDYRF